MPELPEVETERRYFERHGLGRILDRIVVKDARLLRGASRSPFGRMSGRRLKGTRRHGKYMFAEISRGGADGGRGGEAGESAAWLVFHFGMTGSLQRFGEGGEPRTPALVASLRFTDGSGVAFLDARKFGRFGLVADPGEFLKDRGVGPDALSFDATKFDELARGRRGSVKALLMDQGAIAGVGNLYADEILFQAGIHPLTPAAALDRRSRLRLHAAMIRVLRAAIERRADMGKIPRTWLLKHRDEDRICPRCRAPLATLRVAGRTTWFCPRHQADTRTGSWPRRISSRRG